MATFKHSIAAILATLRLWRDRDREAMLRESANETTAGKLHQERSSLPWFLLPPC
jgi:hypothetical protein